MSITKILLHVQPELGVATHKQARRRATSTVTPVVSLVNLQIRVRGTLSRPAVDLRSYRAEPGTRVSTIHRDGTGSSLAAFADLPPPAVVACNLDSFRTLFGPGETNAQLAVYSCRVLALICTLNPRLATADNPSEVLRSTSCCCADRPGNQGAAETCRLAHSIFGPVRCRGPVLSSPRRRIVQRLPGLRAHHPNWCCG